MHSFKKHAVFEQINELSQQLGLKVYLVGGAVREIFLKRRQGKKIDWDFAVSSKSEAFSKKLAEKLRAPCIVLDKKKRTFRVIWRYGDQEHVFDFTDFRGKNLRADLKGRDFTINTLCLDIALLVKKKPEKKVVIDYFNARSDIRNKVLRITNKNNFREDPLRILRGFAFSAQYGLSFEKQTLGLAKKYAVLLNKVSRERIAEELVKILTADWSFSQVRIMDEMGIWQQIFPEVLPLRGLEQGEFHHLDGWDHSLATLAELEKLLKQLPRKISPIDRGKVKEYLNYEISGQRPRLWLLKLACLLHDIGKPQTKTLGPDNRIHFYTHEKSGAQLAVKIGRRLKFSSREIAALKSLVLFHLRAGQLVNRKPASRAKFRFFRDTADNALLILLLSIADRRAMRGRLSREKEFVFLEEELFLMIGEYFKNKEKAQKIIPLFNGYELMDFLSISPGPVIGKILRELKEAQAVNQIRDKQQAKNFAQKIYRKINEAVL